MDGKDYLYKGGDDTSDLESFQLRGGNFVYINEGELTCDGTNEDAIKSPLEVTNYFEGNQNSNTENVKSFCTHKKSYVTNQTKVSECKAVPCDDAVAC